MIFKSSWTLIRSLYIKVLITKFFCMYGSIDQQILFLFMSTKESYCHILAHQQRFIRPYTYMKYQDLFFCQTRLYMIVLRNKFTVVKSIRFLKKFVLLIMAISNNSVSVRNRRFIKSKLVLCSRTFINIRRSVVLFQCL